MIDDCDREACAALFEVSILHYRSVTHGENHQAEIFGIIKAYIDDFRRILSCSLSCYDLCIKDVEKMNARD